MPLVILNEIKSANWSLLMISSTIYSRYMLVLIGFNILNRQIRRVCIVSCCSWTNLQFPNFIMLSNIKKQLWTKVCAFGPRQIYLQQRLENVEERVTDILFIQFFINLYLSGSATFLLISLPRIDQLILIYASRKCCAVSICRNVFHH